MRRWILRRMERMYKLRVSTWICERGEVFVIHTFFVAWKMQSEFPVRDRHICEGHRAVPHQAAIAPLKPIVRRSTLKSSEFVLNDTERMVLLQSSRIIASERHLLCISLPFTRLTGECKRYHNRRWCKFFWFITKIKVEVLLSLTIIRLLLLVYDSLAWSSLIYKQCNSYFIRYLLFGVLPTY